MMVILGGCVSASASLPDSRSVFKPALLRLEDVGPGGPYQVEENLMKLQVIADYLHQEGVPFHIALIPRFVVPQKGYDVSIADDTPYARKFLAAIKYMQSKGGIVGIHGYTHQSGNTVSGNGFEFFDQTKNPSVPDSYEYARERIDKAVSLFQIAGIAPAFWETPHYTASIKQYPAFEEQVGLVYENFHRGELTYNIKTFDHSGPGYRGFVTVPTPLGYVNPEVDVEKLIKRIDNVKDDLDSFFFHPFREFSYIHKNQSESGEVFYTYDPNSPLHVLIKAFKERGNTFVSIQSLAGFVPAQRLPALPFTRGDGVLAGRFGPDDRNMILGWNRRTGQWRMYKYTAGWYSPRREKAFEDLGVWLEGRAPEPGAVPMAADFNGDRRDDLLVYSPGQGTFHLYENRGDKFDPGGEVILTMSGLKSLCTLAGDFNGDGLADLALHDRENYRIGLAYSNGSGFKPIAWQDIDLIKGDGQRLVAGDFNGDGRKDIAVLDDRGLECRLLLTGRNGSFTVSGKPWLSKWASGTGWIPFASDVNGDGNCDLVIYNRMGYWQVNISDGKSFVRWGDFGPWGAGEKVVPLAADLNGDGRCDLAIIDGIRSKGYNLDVALSFIDK